MVIKIDEGDLYFYLKCSQRPFKEKPKNTIYGINLWKVWGLTIWMLKFEK